MQDEPKFFPQRGTTSFPMAARSRPQVAHTVARGQVERGRLLLYRRCRTAREVDALPFPATMAVLERGAGAVQHLLHAVPLARGQRRGHDRAARLQAGRAISTMPSGWREPLSHYFYVITHGYGAMPDYAAQVPPADRWAIAAYIRALQLSQNAKQSDVPAGMCRSSSWVKWRSSRACRPALRSRGRCRARRSMPTPPGPETPGMAPAENITTPVTSRHPQYRA